MTIVKKKSNDYICVIGSGIIGCGIALDFALSKYKVKLISRTQQGVKKAKNRITNDINFLLKINRIANQDVGETINKIEFSSSIKKSVQNSPLIIEAIYENLSEKIALFSKLDVLCDTQTIITSSTSSFLPEQFQVSSKRQKNILLRLITL